MYINIHHFFPEKKDLEIDLIDQYLYEALIDYNDYNKKLLQQLLYYLDL